MTMDAPWVHSIRTPTQPLLGESRTFRWVVDVLIGLLLLFLFWQGAVVWRQMSTEISHFPQALDWAVGPRPTGGYQEVTAQALNHQQPGRTTLGDDVRYVNKNSLSTGPFVVSIDPIGPNTFSAVALGNNGHCYAELSHTYGPNGRYGWTKYARFGRGVRCSGSIASVAAVREGNEPQ
jgi:hypothetical protein